MNIAQTHAAFTNEDLAKLHKSLEGSEFLFEGKLRQWLVGLADMCGEAEMERRRAERSVIDEVRNQSWQHNDELLSKIRERRDDIEGLFAPYLDMSRSGLSRSSRLGVIRR